MEVVIHFNWYNLKNVPEEENKDWKGEDSAFMSEAADQFRSFGASVKSNTLDTSPALLAPTVKIGFLSIIIFWELGGMHMRFHQFVCLF